MRDSYTKRKKEWYPQKRLQKVKKCIEKEEGYMTLFACMLFLALSGLLLLCMDGSHLYQAEARCDMALTGLGEHLLAHYDVPLARRYHLYFTDPRMNEERMEEEAKDYYEELFFGSSGRGLFQSPSWKLQLEELRTEPYGTMQEKEHEFFIAQIEDYMKYNVTKDLVMKVLGVTEKESEEQNSKLEETVEKLDQNESEYTGDSEDSVDNTLTPSEVAEGNQADSEIQDNNPLQKLRSILEYGILGIVADESGLSEKKLSPSLLPFKSQNENTPDISMNLLKNLGNIKETIKEQGLAELTDNLSGYGAVNSYIQKHFNCYGKSPVIKDTVLQYEAEYILGGQNSDKENLEYVVNRLILLRFALNAAYAFSDKELNGQALSLAATLTGITGTPEFMEAVRYIVLAAVNLIESIKDVEALLEGMEVPFVKMKADWKTSINGNVDSSDKKSTGLNYQDHLFLLLTLQTNMEKKCARMQNLMQVNIQIEEPSFQIRECKSGILIESKIRVNPIFVLKNYLLERKQKFCY